MEQIQLEASIPLLPVISLKETEVLYWKSYTLLYSHESPIEAKKMMERGLKLSDLKSRIP
ncbi:Uncharacterised protein [Mycobacteroides abscessus subsp. abscessus]|nr:Uncharacterised protein [Mycobacteroides abscessus subsp. abscessus]